MHVADYHRLVQIPAYTAVEAMTRAGLPVNEDRAKRRMSLWQDELKELERGIEEKAASHGFKIKYSVAHAPLPDKSFRDFLFSPRGLGLEVTRTTDTGLAARDDTALLEYAAIGPLHRPDDDPTVYTILKISSIAKARGTHLNGLLKWRRSDGCCHARIRWDLQGSTRLAAEKPPVHQLPERADPDVAKLVKECIVPREKPWLGKPDDWDPRKHGWCAKVDVKGAEMVIRPGCIAKCPVLSPYIREGRDAHAKTASLFRGGQPEGDFKKGKPDRWFRDSVSKNGGFLLIYGGSHHALEDTLWKKARMRFKNDEVRVMHRGFFVGLPAIDERYRVDVDLAFTRGYIEDFYGRRWYMPMPDGVTLIGWDGPGEPRFGLPSGLTKEQAGALRRRAKHICNCYANRPTQCSQGTTTLWCLALCHHGEYVELRVPDYWAHLGVPFPEAAEWQYNEGNGPGGKPFRVWITNTVHDSLWLDGAPGTLESAMMLAARRFNGVPADFLLESDMPWRVEAEVGPDLGHLEPYEVVAKRFGMNVEIFSR